MSGRDWMEAIVWGVVLGVAWSLIKHWAKRHHASPWMPTVPHLPPGAVDELLREARAILESDPHAAG